jgi:hypothetical protein
MRGTEFKIVSRTLHQKKLVVCKNYFVLDGNTHSLSN